MIKTGYMVLWYGLKGVGWLLAVLVVSTLPLTVPMSIGYLLAGKDGAFWAGIGAMLFILIALVGVLAGADWSGNDFKRWKWEKESIT